jgi:hypothetical protein
MICFIWQGDVVQLKKVSAMSLVAGQCLCVFLCMWECGCATFCLCMRARIVCVCVLVGVLGCKEMAFLMLM